MAVLLRESLFGRLLSYLSNQKIFPHAAVNPFPAADSTKEKTIDFVDDDPEMPRNWSTLAKLVVMTDVMLLNFSFYAASAIFTPSIPKIEETFGATDAEGTLGLSLFVIAYGIGPLIVRSGTRVSPHLSLYVRD